jgi:membrane fusion protein
VRLAQARLSAGAVVRAPRAGRVAAVLATSGSALAVGAPLLVLVDDRAPLLAQVFIPSRAIGFVRVGQEVQLKLDAFAFERYGAHRGVVREISRTALAPRDQDVPQPPNEPVYVALVELAAQQIEAYGQPRALSAGMQLSAEIVIDRPRLIDWLLDPLRALRGR